MMNIVENRKRIFRSNVCWGILCQKKFDLPYNVHDCALFYTKHPI